MSTVHAMSKDHTALQEAKRVLALESSALQALSDHLTESFEGAIACLLACKGRVIISGMGKSGLVGRKIAATLASTGTPAFFVHPAEASHGDLGMVTSEDVLLALSVSGETAELSDIISFAKRAQLPLIAITQRAGSTLDAIATYTLLLPPMEEACPLGLAPTTSTTMMLALGDAIATCLLQAKGFTAEDFGSLHPGGKLGQKLMRIDALMHQGERLPLVTQGTLMQEALIQMTTYGFGCIGIVDQAGMLQGIITDGDLRRHMNADLLTRAVEQVMTAHPKTIAPTLLAVEALTLMNHMKITSFFVVNTTPQGQKPCGFVQIHDFLRANIS